MISFAMVPWGCKFLNGFNFVSQGFYDTLPHQEPEVFGLFLTQCTLLWVSSLAYFMQLCQYGSYSLKMLQSCFCENNNIIKQLCTLHEAPECGPLTTENVEMSWQPHAVQIAPLRICIIPRASQRLFWLDLAVP